MDTEYKDDDLVYIDPNKRVVIGMVEWDKNGNAKKLEMKEVVDPEKGEKKRFRKGKRYYPWGTYKTMKKIHKLEGKEKEPDKHQTLEEAMEMAQKEPFWD
ncbi:hypothetical protein KJ652_03835 [Patescibacteria group bacterium]|nr:hypothetical protein [Patescibacteria group bacterium]MBU1123696.1 hypothetical protein [Patescibacteria group bacterium]MBU1911628.1 hypothetical protein [Patescibacteria group bacterium]